MKNIYKNIFAITSGFLLVFILSTITDIILQKFGVLPSFPQPLFDTTLLLLALSYRTIYTILGGYLTAKLSPEKPLKNVLILGAFGMIIGSVGAILMKEYGPLWYSWGLVLLSLPSVYTGYIFYKYRTLCLKK